MAAQKDMATKIHFNAILAYYRIAGVFLCMSEREGFCVPPVEAMYFNVPIVACDSSAIASTLGGSGSLLSDKDLNITANAIIMAKNNRKEMIMRQQERLTDFEPKYISEKLMALIKSL